MKIKQYRKKDKNTGKWKYQKLKEGEFRPGYAIFARDENGELISMLEYSFSMGWSKKMCCVWEAPPVHYFRPEDGHFLVKVVKQYPDIEFLGYSEIKSNYNWRLR